MDQFKLGSPSDYNLEKEYLKAIDELYGFDPDESPKHLSNTDSTDPWSKIGDSFPNIVNKEDPSISAQEHIQYAFESSVEPPEKTINPCTWTTLRTKSSSKLLITKIEWWMIQLERRTELGTTI